MRFETYTTPDGEVMIAPGEAYRMYGESRVKRWVHLRKVSRVKLTIKGKVTYNLSELEAADKSERV